MKPILCRGKRTDNGEWFNGYPVPLADRIHLCFYVTDDLIFKPEIRQETLCYNTGQFDEGGNVIFENDIVFDTLDNEFCVVEWDDYNSRFLVRYQGVIEAFDIIDSHDLRIVGNIFDDPDLVPWYKQ